MKEHPEYYFMIPKFCFSADKRLVLLSGLPRSGKTTYAQQMVKNCNAVIVNPDSIRIALHGQAFIKEAEPFVWAVAYAMVDSLFIAGHKVVVVDATNTTEKARKPWYDRFGEREDIQIEWVICNVKKEVCIARARATNQAYLISVIERMAAETDIDSLKG